ncbi:helix-turn-helix domain-containing protein, partial [Nocardia cyriacigeorgica]|uniref:helix-turn-helix domain-containing protein n=1 Tax=Nocardia cyriacigeorgica TaxID=135487 RepID=UPI001894AA6D
MADTPDSTVARRELGRQLRTLREEAGLTMESAAASLGISLSTLGRIEKAKVGVRPADVRESNDQNLWIPGGRAFPEDDRRSHRILIKTSVGALAGRHARAHG